MTRERLVELYPATHGALDREVLGDGALLYRWRSGTDLPPLVLMAHYDVVPVAGQEWSRDPFSGLIEDDPGGFRLPEAALDLAFRPFELFLEAG